MMRNSRVFTVWTIFVFATSLLVAAVPCAATMVSAEGVLSVWQGDLCNPCVAQAELSFTATAEVTALSPPSHSGGTLQVAGKVWRSSSATFCYFTNQAGACGGIKTNVTAVGTTTSCSIPAVGSISASADKAYLGESYATFKHPVTQVIVAEDISYDCQLAIGCEEPHGNP